MNRRRQVSQTPSARTLRSATAYFRLAEKARRNNEPDNGYMAHALKLQELGYKQRAAEDRRAAERVAAIEKKTEDLPHILSDFGAFLRKQS
jgi:hypothetical protein